MPVGRFEYNPGVQPQAAGIIANSNARLGDAVIALLTGLAKQKQRDEAKTTADLQDAKAADLMLKADLTVAGDDDSARMNVLKKWGVDSMDQWAGKSAPDKARTGKGVQAAESFQEAITSFRQRQTQMNTDAAGAALLPKVLNTAQDLQKNAPDGTRSSVSGLLMKAMGTLSPDEQRTFGKSAAGQKLLSEAITGGMRDDSWMAREQAITDRAQAAMDSRERIAQAKLDAQARWHEANTARIQAQTDYYRAKAEAMGKLTPSQEATLLMKWLNSTTAALALKSPTIKNDEGQTVPDPDYRDLVNEREDLKSQIGALTTKPAGQPTKAETMKAAPAAKALPVPKTKAELKTGQLYQTSQGPATWNGNQFVTE